ncbi:Pentatricopeptide repeat-containing protein [Acorus calamus]|uniref:Pentatricopeptide repeat-containing protein n=1 Tax=Acorus calamus TaxID=4465 RepID=A0AAV9D7M9_ACOCL|nr:Pentatricopeptide repeat-containing protein [Acorus calamus]
MWRSPQLRVLLRLRCSASYPPPPPPSISSVRSLSSSPPPPPPSDPASEIARSISAELATLSSTASAEDLRLRFPDLLPSPSLLPHVLAASHAAGRASIALHRWISGDSPSDSSVSQLVDFLGRRNDFAAVDQVLSESRGVCGPLTFRAAVDRLVGAGRATQAVAFFERMDRDFGLPRNEETMSFVVTALCRGGFPGHAERMAKALVAEFPPDQAICDTLIGGWCAVRKLHEARRFAGEVERGGFDITTAAYNALLDCTCKLCIEKDPLRMKPETEAVLLEMDERGVPRDAGTFKVLIANFCAIRQTGEALKLFERMGEWSCSADSETYVALIKSLYGAARVEEGDEMIGRMRDAGLGADLNAEAYGSFVKTLCHIRRLDHALKVFKMMRRDRRRPAAEIYEVLIRKLREHGRKNEADALFERAAKNGAALEPKVCEVNPRYVKKGEVKKKKLKRETLPMKTERKRLRLRKLRLSFVKKPKSGMRRAY